MIYRQTALYKFLYYCNESKLDKLVVDCGAGGNMPPLGLFYTEGYQTIGIEMDEEQLKKAKTFEEEHGMELNIRKGDMRKEEIRDTIEEIKRVLKKGGLCYVNLLSCEDFRYGQGTQVGEDEFLQEERGEDSSREY